MVARHRMDRRTQIILGVLALFLITLISFFLPPGVEWQRTFQKAALDVLHGQDPYANPYFFNAPWTVIPLLPLAVLPDTVGRTLFFTLSFAAYAFAAYRFGAHPIALTAFLLSPPVLQTLLTANVDWMPLVGFVLPPQYGLLLISTKPQMGSVVAILWLAQAWQRGGIREVVRVFAPVTVLTLISFLMFGFWPLRFVGALNVGINASLFPLSIPIGLALAVAALRKNRIEYAMGASPALSPYVELHSWAGALLAIVSLPAETIAAVVGLWLLVLIGAQSSL
jgi:hypothetical protein